MGGRKDVWLLANFKTQRWHSSRRMPLVLLAFAFTDASQHPLGRSAHLQEVWEYIIVYAVHGRESSHKGPAGPRIFYVPLLLQLLQLWILTCGGSLSLSLAQYV